MAFGSEGELLRVGNQAHGIAELVGRPCKLGPERAGGQRRHVHAASIHYATKESRRLEEVAAGLIHDREQVGPVFAHPKGDPWRNTVMPLLNYMPAAAVARCANLSERQIKRLRNRHGLPTPRTRARLIRFAAAYARAQLGPDAPADDLTACKVFVERCQAANDQGPASVSGATASAEPKSAQPGAATTDNPAGPGGAKPEGGDILPALDMERTKDTTLSCSSAVIRWS